MPDLTEGEPEYRLECGLAALLSGFFVAEAHQAVPCPHEPLFDGHKDTGQIYEVSGCTGSRRGFPPA